MKKSVLSMAVAAAMTVSATASAGQAEDMERALRSLEAQVSALKAEMAKMKAQQAESSAGPEWVNQVTVGGAVEFDYIDADNAASKFNLSTVELSVGTQISDMVSSNMTLKYEEDESSATNDTLYIDELTVTLGNDSTPGTLTVGKFGAPFGAYETHMISDAKTKGDGDTGGLRAVMVDTVVEGVDVALYAGSGETSINNEIHGITLGLGTDDLTLGAGWINSVAESGDSAWTANVGYTLGSVSLIGEYLDISNSTDTRVYNAEAGYTFDLSGYEALVAVGYGVKDTNNAADDKQTAGIFSVGIAEGTTAAVELLNTDDGATDVDTMTARVAYEF